MCVQRILESFLKFEFALLQFFPNYVMIHGISFVKVHKEHTLELKLICFDLIVNEI